MKRGWSLILALVVCFAALVSVPMTARAEGTVPVARIRTDTMRYWVTLQDAEENTHFTSDYDQFGGAALSCTQADAWWIEKYSHGAVPEARIVFQAPEGAVYFRYAILSDLPGTYAFENETERHDVDAEREAHLSHPIGAVQDGVLTLNTAPFYVLITWEGQNGPLDGGKIEYIKVEPSFPNVVGPLTLPKNPVVPLPEEQLEWYFADMNEYGDRFGSNMDRPGVQFIGFSYMGQDWENSYNQNGHNEPAVEAKILAPEGAAAYMLLDSAEEFDAAAVLTQEGWERFEDAEDPAIFLRYEVAEITEDAKLTTKDIEDTLLIVWKNSENQLVDCGEEQYIQRFTMKIEHENKFDQLQLQRIDIEPMVPYNRTAQPVITNVIVGSTEIPDTLTCKPVENGVLKMRSAMTQQDYQEIYNSKNAGAEQLWFHVSLQPPDGAVKVSAYGSDKFIEDAHEIVTQDYSIFEGEPYLLRTSVTYAAIRRHDTTVMIDPLDAERWLYVSWLDEDDNPINVGTEENPSYVEYLKVELTHADHQTLTVEDDTTVGNDQIIANAGEWEAEYFGRETSIANSKVAYFVSRSKLETLQGAQEDKRLPAPYDKLTTRVKAPDGAVGYELIAANDGSTSSAGAIPESGYIDVDFMLVRDNEGVQDIINGYWMDTYTIRWLNAADEQIGLQRLTVTVQMIADGPWMDQLEEGTWNPAAKERIGSSDSNHDIVIRSDEDGVAYNEYAAAQPMNSALELTVEAPADDRITQYRLASIISPYVEQFISPDDPYFMLVREELDAFDPQPLGKDRRVTFDDIATFVIREVPVDRDGKNFINEIYLHQTYNNNIEDNKVMFVEWLDAEGNPVEREYVYHVVQRMDEEETYEGQSGRYHVDGGYTLVVRHYRQRPEGAQQGEGAYYLHMWLEDGRGNQVQPNGPVTVCMPYPEGTDKNCEFVVEHYQDESHQSLNIEACECRDDGIYLRLSHFSPFMVSWEQGTEPQEPDDTSSSGTIYYPDYDEDGATPEAPAQSTGLYRVTCRKLNIRSGAGTSYSKIGQLSRGDTINGTLLDNGWVAFTLEDGTTAYVCGQYIEALSTEDESSGFEGTGMVICRKLNVRAGASTQSACLGQLHRGEAIRILGYNDAHTWYKIAWNDGEAWVCAKYIG